MRIFDGTLRVQTTVGRKGPFNTGVLITDLGEFKVKDQELEQFAPGTYAGTFWIERIYLSTNWWRGGSFSEVRAQIAPGGFHVNTGDEIADPGPTQVEPDPVDTEHSVASPAGVVAAAIQPVKPSTPATAPVQQTVEADSASLDEDDEALFGVDLYPLLLSRQPIKLDPTVDRERVFRPQIKRLKALGYRFNSTTQTWSLEARDVP